MAVPLEAAHVALSLASPAALVSNCYIGFYLWCGSSPLRVHWSAKNCKSMSLSEEHPESYPAADPFQEL